MNEQMTDLTLCDLNDHLADAGIEALAIRPARGTYRKALVINESEIEKAQALIDELQLDLNIERIGASTELASIEPRTF